MVEELGHFVVFFLKYFLVGLLKGKKASSRSADAV
jgi:hypothetical protein